MNDLELEKERERVWRETAITDIIAIIKNDQTVAHRLARQVGYDKFEEPMVVGSPMPLIFHYSECSISDKGPPKKGTKPSRLPIRYRALIRLSKQSGARVRDVWKTTTDLRDVERARKKLDEMGNPKKCRTPFTPTEQAFVNEAIDVAAGLGYMVGVPHMKPKGIGGTHYVKNHAVLVAPDFSDTFLVCKSDMKTYKLDFPPYATTYSADRPLAKDFILQSRGITHTREINEYVTGHHTLTRLK